jgi:hypothetical protein
MEVSGQLHTPVALPPGKEHWYQLDRRLGGPQSRSGRGGEEKNSQPRRESNPRTPIVQSIAQRYTDWASNLLKLLLYCAKGSPLESQPFKTSR